MPFEKQMLLALLFLNSAGMDKRYNLQHERNFKMVEPIVRLRSIEDDIEKDIKELHKRQPKPEVKMPEYVEQQEGVNTIGVLTSTAMAQEYEKAAKEIELMGEELKATKVKAEEISRFLDEAVEHVNKTAAYYRNECKRIVKQLESYAMLSERVQQNCKDMVGVIGKAEIEPPKPE
jgi:hypothetical protein